jgi:hypothetical protein
MNGLQEYRKNYLLQKVRETWSNVLLDSICPYDDGAIALVFAVCVNFNTIKMVTLVIERNANLDQSVGIINERIAWAFASEHLRYVQ